MDIHETFKTPDRGKSQKHSPSEGSTGVSVSHPATPSIPSPAVGTPTFGFTPRRHFFNPFQLDNDLMQMPVYSPNMFKVTGSVSKAVKNDTESFWSVEHSALIKPVDIQEAEIHLTHRYQQRADREQDAIMQTAINKFFSNQHIVPSPWSDKIQRTLPQTPCTPRTVKSATAACQTALSFPPHVDLLAELGEKYQLPEDKVDPSPCNDSGGSFIRRKLLSQLNNSDSELLGSPALPARFMPSESSAAGDEIISPSSIKQATPEWEKNTPDKLGPNHFSSSPILSVPNVKSLRHVMYDNDLLALPELSPITGPSTKHMRSSFSSPQAVMKLDFSSILDDPDEADNDASDKVNTMVQQGIMSVNQNGDTSSKDSFYFR